MLAGVEDPGMLPAVATIALQLAGALKEGISDGSFFYASSNHKAEYSTKPWAKPKPSQKRSSVTSTSQLGSTQPAWWRERRGGNPASVEVATNRNLVVEILRLFCTLSAQANQAGAPTEGAVMWSHRRSFFAVQD